MSPAESAVLPRASAPAPDDPRLGAWRAFLLAHARLSRRLDEELRSEHGLTLPEYDALLQIAQAPERRLRMSQLAEAVVLSRSGVTRLIDRLVADGLVTRSQCLSDARGAEAVLTDAGLERLRRAAGTHLRGIEQYFLSVVPDSELDALERTLHFIADRAGPGWPVPDRCAVEDAPLKPGGGTVASQAESAR
jgi:DNA-binding MarR family transcriptional regulator